LGIDARTAEIDVNPKETWAQSASELSQSIRLRQVSCVEVVEAALQRISDINPDVNAVVEVLGEQALDQARRHDSVLAGSDPQPGPLFGVPFTAKINVDVAGLATTNGVAAFSDLVAIDDNPCIWNLRDAGGICIGRTNVPAFSARYFTDNEFYGRTLNPWNKAITPGGSSGGAAVAVATGMGGNIARQRSCGIHSAPCSCCRYLRHSADTGTGSEFRRNRKVRTYTGKPTHQCSGVFRAIHR